RVVDGPEGVDELADDDRSDRRGAGAAIVILEIHAGGTGDVPAIVEFLRAGRADHRQATQQGGAEEFLIHLYLLVQVQLETASARSLPLGGRSPGGRHRCGG